MEKRQPVRASAVLSTGRGGGAPCAMTPAMTEQSAARVSWVAGAWALTAGVGVVMNVLFQPETENLRRDAVYSVTLVAVMLYAVGLVAVQRLRVLAPVYVLNLGLVFVVVVSWIMSYSETFHRMEAGDVVRGGSTVTVWLAFVLMLVRLAPPMTLVVALVAATAWPAAYYFNVWQRGYEVLPMNRLAMWLWMPYMAAIWAYFLNQRIFRIELKAQRAEELGSYQVCGLIGQGGMGEVWRARHRMLARDAAIKIIRTQGMGGGSARQADLLRKRFEREAKATASLECPYTVYIFDFGVTSEGEFYYVMELLNGISLQAMVDRFGPMPAGRVAHFMRQACVSLEEAHRKGLIHRDIKPANLFSCRVGLEADFTKVLDFGLVKHTDGSQRTLLTEDGGSAGTPAYMAPEAALGEEKVDGRLDIYSLGCVAYFLLTGSLVFEESSPTAIAIAHVQKPPIPARQRTELPVPESLDRVVMQCLAKSPEDRPFSAAELIRLLDGCEGIKPWTQEDAGRWWRDHLPEHLSGAPVMPSDSYGTSIVVR